MTAIAMPRRILLKLSGEILSGVDGGGIDPTACQQLAHLLKKLVATGLEVAIVIGGGNIFRGKGCGEMGIARTPADQMGMLATMINGIAIQQALQALGVPAKAMSALECPRAIEPYNWASAMEYLAAKKLLIFVGGTGLPYFTTDTAAALRASEIGADMLIKATKVDGIYDKDPMKFDDAQKYQQISYSQVLAEKLQVMDATSIALCRSNSIPIFVLNMQLLFGDISLAEILAQRQGSLVTENPI